MCCNIRNLESLDCCILVWDNAHTSLSPYLHLQNILHKFYNRKKYVKWRWSKRSVVGVEDMDEMWEYLLILVLLLSLIKLNFRFYIWDVSISLNLSSLDKIWLCKDTLFPNPSPQYSIRTLVNQTTHLVFPP